MTVVLIALAVSLGFQSGLIVMWRYYKRQRDDQDTMHRQYEARIELLEHDLQRERKERRRDRRCCGRDTLA